MNQLQQYLIDHGADITVVDAVRLDTNRDVLLSNIQIKQLSKSKCLPLQQGHSPSYYRDHPQDIRHRTVQSRRPPPPQTHLIKGDPDSATGIVSIVSGCVRSNTPRPPGSVLVRFPCARGR